MPQRTRKPLADLHNHLGASVRPSILWSIAHRQGIKLPTKSYWEFEEMIVMRGKERNRNLEEMHERFFRWTELIQSSPEAIEESVKAVIDGAYRRGNITLHELRFNPMKRNRGGERDLDHIIMSAIWGMDKALLEYPQVRAGIILIMDRGFPPEQNMILVDKAVKYAGRGVLPHFAKARAAGLGITVHTGEERQLDEMRFVVEEVRPDRIGHGVQCVRDPRLMRRLAELGVTLEICPTSNLRNSVIGGVPELKRTFRALLAHDVPFVLCTDGPEMYQTHLYQEQSLLVERGILTAAQVEAARTRAFKVSFV
jgi:adenosine deaminase